MKSVKHLFLLGTAMAVMSSSAFADTTGTQTFTANVTANTCTIANLNQVVNLGDVNKTEFKGITGSLYHFALGHGVNTTFEVTGCPATITTVEATPMFTGNDMYVKNAGTSTTAVIHLGRTPDGTQLTREESWYTGVKKSFAVSNAGAASLPVKGILTTLYDAPVAGTLQFNVTFA
ncbi:type 1 fimbrial protein, partial [Salmonella enterica]|nr:type 1 fimbrial protein [Salmonella enterica]EFT9846433.1 type 1 fimbrial protein [Salmonella enterica]EFU0047637.1 type 1 fimbrial protein [Salmonella enterica]EFV5168535.1 type 1 fimbrial protein [Salmonella enterica]EGG3330680.1 type 1 fimbrial protein [Salmonella enterica]